MKMSKYQGMINELSGDDGLARWVVDRNCYVEETVLLIADEGHIGRCLLTHIRFVNNHDQAFYLSSAYIVLVAVRTTRVVEHVSTWFVSGLNPSIVMEFRGVSCSASIARCSRKLKGSMEFPTE